MSADGPCTKWRRNIAENFNRLSRVHERYRQTTDGRTTAYNEREPRLLKTIAFLSTKRVTKNVTNIMSLFVTLLP